MGSSDEGLATDCLSIVFYVELSAKVTYISKGNAALGDGFKRNF